MQRIDPGTIARRYFDPDTTPHAATPETLARYLRTMLDDLVQLALRNGSAALAAHLKASIKQHGSAKLTAVTLRMVEQASTLAAAAPSLDHHVGLWFRPLVTKRLSGEGIDTLEQLVEFCNSHGGSWWRSVPRIGPQRARTRCLAAPARARSGQAHRCGCRYPTADAGRGSRQRGGDRRLD